MWLIFAILSAVFAALTSIFAKIGIDGVDSNLATAIRTVVVVLMAWGIVFITGAQNGLGSIGRKSWLFLILSGLATGASWLCYFYALKAGDVSKVVPIDKLSIVLTLVLAGGHFPPRTDDPENHSRYGADCNRHTRHRSVGSLWSCKKKGRDLHRTPSVLFRNQLSHSKTYEVMDTAPSSLKLFHTLTLSSFDAAPSTERSGM